MEQHRFKFALWARAMVRELIRERVGVRFSEVTVGRLVTEDGADAAEAAAPRCADEQNSELFQPCIAPHGGPRSASELPVIAA